MDMCICIHIHIYANVHIHIFSIYGATSAVGQQAMTSGPGCQSAARLDFVENRLSEPLLGGPESETSIACTSTIISNEVAWGAARRL